MWTRLKQTNQLMQMHHNYNQKLKRTCHSCHVATEHVTLNTCCCFILGFGDWGPISTNVLNQWCDQALYMLVDCVLTTERHYRESQEVTGPSLLNREKMGSCPHNSFFFLPAMDSCYVCKQSLPCPRRPLHELRERGHHIKGALRDAWGLGNVRITCCGAIYCVYCDVETTTDPFTWGAMSKKP